MVATKTVLVLFLVALLVQECKFWRRRRRRRRRQPICRPARRDCTVSAWGNWGACTHQCGNSGTSTRTRHRTVNEACGGRCPYQLRETRACNRHCPNGGTPQSGRCSCRPGLTGTCCTQDVNECLRNPCQHICTNTFGSYTCKCHACYTKVNTRCDLRQCKIAGKCYTYNTVNPSNPCQQCNSNNKFRWTNNNNLRCSDNNVKTRNDRCVNGTCVGTSYNCLPCEQHDGSGCPLKSGHCIITHQSARTCFANQQLKPGNPCQWCSSNTSTSSWSNRNGLSCNDGNACTKGDTCTGGECRATPFTCNSLCQFCNGNTCSLKTGFGYRNGKCTCRIGGSDYNHQVLNPSNQCQWCYLHDASARTKGEWTSLSTVPCDDGNKCTKNDACNAGRCTGQPYSCQASYPSSSCIQRSLCVGDGTCRDVFKPKGTICRAAVDICDQPERCSCSLGGCPAAVTDGITLTTGSVQLMSQPYTAVVSYQHLTNTLYLNIAGFSSSCGTLTYKWYLLDGAASCSATSSTKGTLPCTSSKQRLTGLSLRDNKSYKVSIQAVDMRGNVSPPVCSGIVTVMTSFMRL